MHWIQPQINQKDGLFTHSPLSPLLSSSLSSSSSSPSYEKELTPTLSPSSGSKISPAVLFIIVILAVIFFISGILHLLVRFLTKQRSPNPHSNRYPQMSNSNSAQRQLQQLFHLHDSGLDQAFIDALPVFYYKEIMGLKEPFDCAVCLCEFSEQDKLRLLPLCSHAFHIDCIDTWLLSNSTCPLCRGTLFTPGFSIENPIFDFDDTIDENGFSGNLSISVSCGHHKPAENDIMNIVSEKKMFSVRLGKFKSINVEEERGEREIGETSSSSLDARRCYSMGSFQYVVANDSDLQVEFCPKRDRLVKRGNGFGDSGDSSICGDVEGKKINMRSKGESFSVSKIWLWSKRGNFTSSSDNTHMVSSSVHVSLPWIDHRAAQVT